MLYRRAARAPARSLRVSRAGGYMSPGHSSAPAHRLGAPNPPTRLTAAGRGVAVWARFASPHAPAEFDRRGPVGADLRQLRFQPVAVQLPVRPAEHVGTVADQPDADREVEAEEPRVTVEDRVKASVQDFGSARIRQLPEATE